MDSNWVFILLLGVAMVSYYAGMNYSCGKPKILYRFLPRNLEESDDPNATRVLSDMVNNDIRFGSSSTETGS